MNWKVEKKEKKRKNVIFDVQMYKVFTDVHRIKSANHCVNPKDIMQKKYFQGFARIASRTASI